MRAEQLASKVPAAVTSLSSSAWRVWCTSFVLAALLTGLWVLANPLYAGPDEPAHVIRAVALDHGQLTGKPLSPQLRETLRGERDDFLMVRVPAVYGIASDQTCFAYKSGVTAECLLFDGPITEVDDATYVARHPPAYYAVVGAASWIGRPGSGTVYLMRLLTVLMTSALIATAMTAVRRSTAPRLIAVGLAVAITPMVLFVNSIVNPSAVEITGALAVWVCGLLLISRAHERVDTWLVTAVGVAGCVMALSRQLAPLWLGLIVLSLLGVAKAGALRNLWRSSWARLWGAIVLASVITQAIWNVLEPVDVSAEGRPPMHLGGTAIARTVSGLSIFRYHEMIGIFGWGDTATPALTWIPWTAVILFLFFAAVLWASKRYVAGLFALLAVVIVVPIVIESLTYNEGGGVNWQGRYTLPIAVGVPILAAFVLASTERGRQLVTSRLLVAIGATLGVAQFLAFAQNLRRYTVGYQGDVTFWRDPRWTPPLPPLLLTAGFALVVAAFLWWLLAAVPGSATRDDDTSGLDSGRQTDAGNLETSRV